MEIQNITKTTVAAHTFKTTLSKIGEAVGIKPNQLMEELAKQGIEPTAPQIWNYLDCDGQMDKEFSLQICVPVKEKGSDTDFMSFAELEDFKCVSYTHEGPWSEFQQVYCSLFEKIEKEKINHSGKVREVYHHCDMEDQSKCVTEIQVGVQ